VSSNHAIHLRESYLSIPVRAHINNMNNWNNEQFDLVWWDAHEKALSKFSNNPLLLLKKYLDNRLPTNRRENKYHKYIAEGCYLCKEAETQAHILQCKFCEQRTTARRQFIIDIKSFMNQTYLSIDTIQVISSCLFAWLNQEEIPTVEYNEMLLRAYKEQTELGWENWFKGRLTRTLREVYIKHI
jgi:hypothetical protein